MEPCFRHGDRRTGVHCSRCGRAVCWECMVEAPVGVHCPACVAEGRSTRRATRRVPWVTPAIALATVALFLLARRDPLLARRLRFDEAAVAAGDYHRLLTLTLVHDGWLHLAVNTVSLLVLGAMLEPLLGRWRFAGLYAVGALGAATATFLVGPVIAVGASGAVFALVGASIAMARGGRLDPGRLIAAATGSLVIAVVFPSVDHMGHAGGLLTGLIAGGALEWSRGRAYAVARDAASFVAVSLLAAALVGAGLRWAPPKTFFQRILDAQTDAELRGGLVPLATLLRAPPLLMPAYQAIDGERASYTLYALRDPEGPRTAVVDFGDGTSATIHVPKGSGWAAERLRHRFPPGLARYTQTASYQPALAPGGQSVTDVCPPRSACPAQ